MPFEVADALSGYDFRLRLSPIPIRQISRQAIGALLQVCVGRTLPFRQVKGRPRESDCRTSAPRTRPAGGFRRRTASPGRSGSRAPGSRDRLRRRRRRSRRRWSSARMRRKAQTGRVGCARSDGRLCGALKTSAHIIACRRMLVGRVGQESPARNASTGKRRLPSKCSNDIMREKMDCPFEQLKRKNENE